MCTYLWCCVVSAAKREGKPFDMSLMDFADSLAPEVMTEWSNAISVDAATVDDADGEKKVCRYL